MGHLLTVPSAPNWRSINTGKWESCRSKEQRRLRRCSANVKLLHVSVLMAQRRFFFLSLTGWWDRNQGENNQFLVLSLSAYYFKAHCLTTWWKGCFFLQNVHSILMVESHTSLSLIRPLWCRGSICVWPLAAVLRLQIKIKSPILVY